MTTSEQHHPFDPAVMQRLRTAVNAAKGGAVFASPRTADLEQLLNHLDSDTGPTDEELEPWRNEVTRIARDVAEARETVAGILLGIEMFVGFPAIQSLDIAALPHWATPWLDAERATPGQEKPHAPAPATAAVPATVETNPTPNRPQTGPPLEAAGIFFPGSTPSAIPAEEA